jgi:dipeptidyl aminopeptidase/acylaminoacyl peptidase
VKPEQVGPFKMIDYKAADGTKLQGVLTLPPGREPKKLPLVVLPHGGPQARDYPSFDFWAQAYASRGYAVWQPNFRGSAGYGVGLVNAGHGEFGRKMQTDISDGVAELARQGIVDPHRACIVGASYGGYAALAGVTLQQGLYRCAVAVAGVTDLKDFLTERRTRLGADGMRYWMQYLGAKNTGDDLLEALSPTRLAARADAPVLLIHGKDDTIVPIRQSQLMKRALEKANKPVEMITLDGEDHYLSREATRIDMLRAAVAFVQKHNPVEAGAQTALDAQAAAN